MQQLGGNNGYEFIRRGLSMLLTNKLADKYSFFGWKKKKPFCNLNICKILISECSIKVLNKNFIKINLIKFKMLKIKM